jgi:Ulp1 protease family, C-terminal catalytic domain
MCLFIPSIDNGLTFFYSEYIRKCFERDADVPVKSASQAQPLANVKHQPISNPLQFTSTTSPHFQNQQTFSSNNVSGPPKLIKQLQSSSSAFSNPTAMSASPTIITGKDRANESAAKLAEQITTAGTKTTISEQAGSPSASRLRSSSGKIATRSSSLRGKMSIDGSEDGVQRKNSETHGFGEPWKNPLIYPKTGRRRMAVEYGDLYRLDEDEFLNDNLIGFFLRYLEYHLEQTNPEVAKKVYFYNSYFFERLMQTSKAKKGINYDSVQKWTRNVDIFSRDFIVLPVNESFHWYVVIICNLSKINTVDDDDDDGDQDIQSGKSPLVKLVITGREGDYEVRKGNGTEEGHDQPTEKTTESLSHLSLSDHGKQVDELAPSINVLPFLSSPGAVPTPTKSGRGRRKAARHSLPKYNVSAPVIMTFDSLGAARSSTCTALRQYIVEEAKNKKGWDIDGSLIKGMTAKGIPTQPNFSDCGLYLCAYMEKFILDPAMFVGKILQREMDPSRDIPLMASEELRSRMRGMIIELHHEQEGEVPEFPIPEIGRILLAPLRAVSSNNVSAPRTPLQDDSEDELQQDHPKLDIVKTARSPSATARVVAGEHDQTPLTSAPLCRDSTPSETANTMTEVLAKINANAESHPKSDSGTRETAITIDDDEDPQSVFQRGPAKGSVIAKDNFFEHPAKLKGTATASNTSASHQRTEGAFPDVQSLHRRSQSRASAETVTTDYLSGSANRSYRHDEQDTDHDTGAKSGHVQEKVVLMVPDSQQSQETGTEENADIEGMGAENEPVEILEGIE